MQINLRRNAVFSAEAAFTFWSAEDQTLKGRFAALRDVLLPPQPTQPFRPYGKWTAEFTDDDSLTLACVSGWYWG